MSEKVQNVISLTDPPVSEGNIPEQLEQTLNNVQQDTTPPVKGDPIVKPPIHITPMSSVIPIEKYRHADIRRTLKADRKRIDREVELQYIQTLTTDNQKAEYFRLKSSEERKLIIKGILIVLMFWIGGVTAMLEIVSALGGL